MVAEGVVLGSGNDEPGVLDAIRGVLVQTEVG